MLNIEVIKNAVEGMDYEESFSIVNNMIESNDISRDDIVGAILRLCKVKEEKVGRKEEVLAYIQSVPDFKIQEVAEALGLSDKNISSQLCYLRKDGVQIGTKSNGRKFIEAD